jgi:Beta-galactosidase/beta-glucuronidase
MWSLGNEPDTEHFPEDARDYWKRLSDKAHKLDPQSRPVTVVCCQNDYTKDLTARAMDVACVNRYYGWYNLSGSMEIAEEALAEELDYWKEIGKPLILTEYGADAISGMHKVTPEMFSEEFQVEYLETINSVLDRYDFVIGEHPWNFADFDTQQGPMRAGGNHKGLFNRDRTPKMAAHYCRSRWNNGISKK